MTGILIKSTRYAAILALAIGTTGSAQEVKKSRAIWEGVEILELAWSYDGRNIPPANLWKDSYVREKIVIKFTYIEETDFKTHGRLLSKKISWNAYLETFAKGYRERTCNSAGDLELVGLSRDTIEKQLKFTCKEKVLGNPNSYWLPKLTSFPVEPPKMVDWRELRDGRSYSEKRVLVGEFGNRHDSYSVQVKRIRSCADYNAGDKFPGGVEPKAGDIQIIPDASSITPDGKTTLRITFTCDSMPVKYAKLDVTIEVVPNSGGHIHEDDRPRGKLKGIELTSKKPSIEIETDSDGKADVRFEPGKDRTYKLGIAGIYRVIAKGQNDSEGSAVVTAEVKGLEPLTAGDGYKIVRNGTDTHPEGTYGTAATLKAIPLLANDFNAAQVRFMNGELTNCKPPKFAPGQLSINDISLPSGGFFDWKANWKETHQTHGKGTGVDFNHFFETQQIADCDSKFPSVPLSAWLSVLMLELGERYGHWDQDDLNRCSDIKCAGFPPFHLHVKQ